MISNRGDRGDTSLGARATGTIIGPSVPRRGNAFSRWLGRWLLSVLGWRIEGEWPDEPRVVVVVAPHTSNWDVVLAILVTFALGLRVSWIGKATLFRWPFGGLLRGLGGIPIDRGSSEGKVSRIAEFVRRSEGCILGISPEGTRKRAERWRSGFYHVARQAEVPILLTHLDYRRRVAGIGPVFEPTGDAHEDIEAIRASYRAGWARFPEQV